MQSSVANDVVQEVTAGSQNSEREWSGATVAANDVVQEATEASPISQKGREVPLQKKEGSRQSRIC